MEQRDYSLSTTARLPRLFILYVYVFGYIGQLIDQSQGCQASRPGLRANFQRPRPRADVCGLDLEWNEAEAEAQRPKKTFLRYIDSFTTCIILGLGLGLSFKIMFLPESCVRAVSDLRNICCSVLLAFFNYITKICHIITTVVNSPIPVHLSASASDPLASASKVRPRPHNVWPRYHP